MILDGVVAGQRTPCAAEPAGEATLVGGFDAERPDQRGDRGFAQQEGTAGEVGRQTGAVSLTLTSLQFGLLESPL